MIKQDTMNIAIAINDGFIMPARVMLHSLFKRTKRPIHLFLLYNALSVDNRRLLKETVEEYGNSYEEIYIDETWFRNASLNRNPLYSIEIYYRILLPYLTSTEKMLWLDADLVVTSDIAELYDKNISEYYLAACIDVGEEKHTRDKIKEQMRIVDQVYFNSGVLLMNNQKIREQISQNQFFEAIEKFNDNLICPDQDILNYVLGGNSLILPIYYNYQHHTDSDSSLSKGMIIHYIWKKPWNADYPGYLDEVFWNEAVECGFKKEYKQYKKERKHIYYKNELLPSIKKKLRIK